MCAPWSWNWSRARICRSASRRGPIPLDEALPIATQIAEALEAAHEQGIIHRDLKPANIKVRADGTVKVLDFGLAKAMESTIGSSASVSESPTITTPAMTQAGMILGTAAYMSPEQARGKPVDKRTDIWAFGCVLYEMLTGMRPFPGDDVAEVLSRVLQREPDWARLPSTLSPLLGSYIKRCLHKDPRQRIHDIADVRLALEGAFETTVMAVTPASRPRGLGAAWVVALAAVLAAAVLAIPAVRYLRHSPPPSSAVHFEIQSPESTRFGGPEGGGTGIATQLAVSPDGRHVVFVAAGEGGYRLWLRPT